MQKIGEPVLTTDVQKFFENVNSEYISSDRIIRLYFLAISEISSNLSQTCPEGLFGEFKNNK